MVNSGEHEPAQLNYGCLLRGGGLGLGVGGGGLRVA